MGIIEGLEALNNLKCVKFLVQCQVYRSLRTHTMNNDNVHGFVMSSNMFLQLTGVIKNGSNNLSIIITLAIIYYAPAKH